MNIRLSIISSGQAGGDRAALDWAIKHGFPHGGWCPKDRLAQDGPLDVQYRLKETPLESPLQRIEWNVRDSDATVVLTLAPKAAGGAMKALSFARKSKRPCLHLHKGVLAAAAKLAAFVETNTISRLNVAGSGEADEPGIAAWVTDVLEKMKAILEMER